MSKKKMFGNGNPTQKKIKKSVFFFLSCVFFFLLLKINLDETAAAR